MTRVDIVLTDGFPLLSLTLLTEPMRVANRERLEEAYEWRFLSVGGATMRSSSGYAVVCAPLDHEPTDGVIVLSSYGVDAAVTPELVAWLRARDRAGALLGCVDTAALIFAQAGLLETRPAAAHFEALPGYLSQFPESLFVDRLFDFSPPRCSSAGGVATMDMTLAMIAHFSGARLARRVSEILTYVPSEHLGAQERLLPDRSLAYVNRDVARAVEIMLNNREAPLAVADIAARLEMPPWRLTQLFRRYLRKTPSEHYRNLRLERARNLLRNSHNGVGEIASLCGFENHESFTRAYRRAYGRPPSRDRFTVA